VCSDGRCVAPCDLVTCEASERCREGVCEADPCFGVDCGTEARCVEGACIANGTDDAASATMDSGPRRDAGTRAGATSEGCGCSVPGSGEHDRSRAVLVGLGLLALVLGRRASKRSR
jgi:hypothetical protein